MSGSMHTISKEEIIERERTAKIICAELNNFTDLKPVLITIIKHIRRLITCEAVGIRLHDEDDYPYFTYQGFPESFIRHETHLCALDNDGKRIPLADGKGYMLECMCGNVIRGRTDPRQEFFTEKGSFWTNSTSELLASTTEDERQSGTRNFCNKAGYESVALIPIKYKEEKVGLIQLNDKRKGIFTRNLIEYLEMIGEQIGAAIHNSLIYTKLKKALTEIHSLRGILPICSCCKKIRDDNGYWESVEIYIQEHSDADFSHGICPECAQKYHGLK
ncbi:MAG: GAF domain-containing protein [Spirochaetales bacterium]|nr:GAF domain-containing protein [Spirochaetales bacterium]